MRCKADKLPEILHHFNSISEWPPLSEFVVVLVNRVSNDGSVN